MNERSQSLSALKSMAKKIHFISFDVVRFQDKEMRSHWYQYESLDLYYFEKTDKEMVKIHINVFGQVVEWNGYDGVRTGVLIEEEKEEQIFEVLQYDSRPNSSAIAQCLLVLENAFQIDQTQRQQMIECIQNKHAKSFWEKLKHTLRRPRQK